VTEITFTVPMTPVAKARARSTGRGGRHITPSKTRKAEADIATYATRAMAGRQPLTGPVELRLAFYFTPPASWPASKREKALRYMAWKISKPDVDNLQKSVMDAGNGILWKDDSQIAVIGRITKQYDTAARIEVAVKAMEDWIVSADPK